MDLTPLRRAAAAILMAPLLATASPQSPPSPEPTARPVPTFGTTTELVYVRFHVEKKGGYLDALKPDQVRVLEDGQPQKIALLETPATRERTVPPEVTLALDVSSSVMDDRLLDESLLKEVLFATLGEQARIALCAFGGELKCLTPPTRDADALMNGFQQAIEFSHEQRRAGTRLYASLADLAKPPKDAEKAQRALIVFSDGLDNKDGKMGQALDAALAADVRVYTIALSQSFQATSRSAPMGGGTPNRTMYDYKKLDFGRLAELTGGRPYEPATLSQKDLAKVLHSIATEISMENVVGYQPEGPAGAPRKRKVKVELADKSLGKIPDGERTLLR
ncbi:MAG TPA: VWA domain-containing protein [Vicinamibacteria bacterium]|nr:VWA domain-containing protein [Vicinamibacteria bacterium]